MIGSRQRKKQAVTPTFVIRVVKTEPALRTFYLTDTAAVTIVIVER